MKKCILKTGIVFFFMLGILASCSYHLETKGLSDNASDVKVTKLKIYMDASVSMRGFVDFAKISNASSDFNRDVPIILSDLRKKIINNSEDDEEYYLVNEWNNETKPKPENWNTFKNRIISKDTYTGQNTEIYSILKKCINEIHDNDISIFITDCVLSEGAAKIHSSGSDNTKFFGDLQREVKEAFDKAFDSNLSVAIVRHKENYNGYYYTSCKELPVPQFRDSLMSNRPLYYIILGNSKCLSEVVNSFESKRTAYEICYFPKEQQQLRYSLLESDKCAGLSGIFYGNSESEKIDSTYLEVHINLDDFIDGEPIELYLCLSDLSINSTLCKVSSQLGVSNEVFFTAESVLKSECQNSVSVSDNDFWSRYGCFYRLKFKNASVIRATDMNPECELSLLLSKPWKNSDCSVGSDSEKDYNLSLKQIEGKTFGFTQFLEAIDYSSFGNNAIIMDAENSMKIGGVKLKIIIDK